MIMFSEVMHRVPCYCGLCRPSSQVRLGLFAGSHFKKKVKHKFREQLTSDRFHPRHKVSTKNGRPLWSSGSMLVIGPKIRGFKPGRGRWTLRVIIISSMTFFRKEIKPSALRCNEYEINNLWTKLSGHFSSSFSGLATRRLCW
jgi:hypothetical protein